MLDRFLEHFLNIKLCDGDIQVFSSPLLQAFPQLPEDVLRVHADAVQRPSLAQHNPFDNSKSVARCVEEGHLEGTLAHHY